MTAEPAARPRVVAIMGPTASGKAALGRRVARRLDAPLLVCDSVKVYRRLDIGSAKPSLAERRALEHRLIDLVDPDASFSAGDWARAADAELAPTGRGVVAGGTGFYLRHLVVKPTGVPALADVAPDDPRRRDFEANWSAQEAASPGAVHRALSARDPTTAAEIHPHNVVRALRALWLCEVCGGPISRVRADDPPRPRVRLQLVVLDPGVDAVDARIEARVDAMLNEGWVAEVEKLVADGYDERCKSMQSLGYRQLLDVVAGRTPLPAARDAIVAATRQYARRQRTYLRRQLPAHDVLELRDAGALDLDRVVAFWEGRA